MDEKQEIKKKQPLSNIHIGVSALTNIIYLYQGKQGDRMVVKRPVEQEFMNALVVYVLEGKEHMVLDFNLGTKKYILDLKEVK